MNYLWEEFNDIPVFPSNPAVFLDGIYRADLSEAENIIYLDDVLDISAADKPTHIIVRGGEKLPKKIILRTGADVYLTAQLSGANVKMEIDAVGAKSDFRAGIFIKNTATAKMEIDANHKANDTKISVDVRIQADRDSETTAQAAVNIGRGITGAVSNISLSAMADRGIKHLKLSPSQFISTIPRAASHSANLLRGAEEQVRFLNFAGLDRSQADAALLEAFRKGTFNHLPR